MTKGSSGGLRRALKDHFIDGTFNILWTAVTLLMLAPVYFLWPFQTWAWGLVFGAVVGGTAIFLTLWLTTYTRLPRLLGVYADV